MTASCGLYHYVELKNLGFYIKRRSAIVKVVCKFASLLYFLMRVHLNLSYATKSSQHTAIEFYDFRIPEQYG